MIGRKSVVGLSLLAAFAFWAIAVQGASAAWQNAINTTAYTCVPGGGNLDFSDAHCDKQVTPPTGSFGHELIPSGPTSIETSNTATKNATTEAEPAVLTGTLAGSSVVITCKKVEPDPSVTSFIENKGTGTNHEVAGTSAVNFTECTVTKLANCTVVEPITVASKFHGVEEPTAKAMGLEFEPDGSTNFVEITFGGGAGCAVNGKTFPVKGTAIGTGTPGSPGTKEKWSGATVNFETGNGMENLTLGGNAAGFTAKFTTRMANAGNPITLTTVT